MKNNYKLNNTTDLQILKSRFRYDLNLNEERIQGEYYIIRENLFNTAKSAVGNYAKRIGIYLLISTLSSYMKRKRRSKR